MTDKQEIRIKALEIAAISFPRPSSASLEIRFNELEKYAKLIERCILDAGLEEKKP